LLWARKSSADVAARGPRTFNGLLSPLETMHRRL